MVLSSSPSARNPIIRLSRPSLLEVSALGGRNVYAKGRTVRSSTERSALCQRGLAEILSLLADAGYDSSSIGSWLSARTYRTRTSSRPRGWQPKDLGLAPTRQPLHMGDIAIVPICGECVLQRFRNRPTAGA